MCNITLIMMPGKLMTLVEFFGYKDRKIGLELMKKASGRIEVSDEIGTGELCTFLDISLYWE